MKPILTIMIIDDEPVNNFICRRTIEHFDPNIEVIEFEKAKDALTYFEGQSKKKEQKLPDILFLDLNMPMMDGWQFLEQYKNLMPYFNNDIDLFLLTSSSFEGDLKRARSFPVISYYITKPLTIGVLEKIKLHQVPQDY
ncbi:MAG: response regulator [Cytophagales bacterium]